MKLDPQARFLLDLVERSGMPPVWQQTPTEARQSYRERRFYTQEEAPTDVATVALTAPGPLGPIPMRAFRPHSAAKDEVLPVLLYFHGGGWTIGDLDTHDVLCRQLSREAGCAVVSVDYRLGPEFRFPAALEDCWAATCWISAHGEDLGMDPSRLAVGGDSAGGNLAAVVSLLARDRALEANAQEAGRENPEPAADPAPNRLGPRGDPPICFQLLIYPSTEMLADTPSMRINGEGYMLTSRAMSWFVQQYMGETPRDEDLKNWRASPLRAASLAGLPPALILTAGFDPLRDEGREYADRLSEAGTAAQYVCFERQIHGFVTMTRLIDEASTAVRLCAGELRRAFARV